LAFFKNFDKMNLRNVADFSFKEGSRIFKQRAPIQNEVAFSKPKCGTREVRPAFWLPKKPFSSLILPLLYQIRTYFQNK